MTAGSLYLVLLLLCLCALVAGILLVASLTLALSYRRTLRRLNAGEERRKQ
jgi:uncharacterized integral membrane protein